MSDSNRLIFTAAAIGLIALVVLWGVIGIGVLSDRLNQSAGQTMLGASGVAAVLLTLGLNAVATFAAIDQARTARRALEDFERPYLLSQIKQRPQGLAKLYAEKGEPRAFDTSDTTSYRFHNHGRSPALIVKYHRARIGRWASDGPPPPIDPLTDAGLPAPHGVIVPVGRRSQKFKVGEFRPADPARRQGDADHVIWWFQGYVVYRDTSGTTYALGFCHFYSAYHRRWFLLGSSDARHDRHNYDRRIDPTRMVRSLHLV